MKDNTPIIQQTVQLLTAEDFLEPHLEKIKSLRRIEEALHIKNGFLGLGLRALAFMGGTGVGKSSLFNLFSGYEVAKVSSTRPCTTKPLFMVQESLEKPLQELLNKVLKEFSFEIITHDCDELMGWLLIDVPDYDSVCQDNHPLADLSLLIADLIFFVVSPAKYGDDLSLRWYGAAKRLGRSCQLVFNKTDTLSEGVSPALKESLDKLYVGGNPVFSSCVVSSDESQDKLVEIFLQRCQEVKSEEYRSGLQAEFSLRFWELALLVDEDFGLKNLEIRQFSDRIDSIHKAFYERLEWVQKSVEDDLQTRLKKIADEKVFYVSKWVVRHLFSFVDSWFESSPAGAKVQNEGQRLEQEITSHLFLALEQTKVALHQLSSRSSWVSVPDEEEWEKQNAEFGAALAGFRKDMFERIEATFHSHVKTRHTVAAVSQEVGLSLVFYLVLGPVGLVPGWDQLLSAVFYLFYGKMPGSKLPTILLEFEQLSNSCRGEFQSFLNHWLKQPLKQWDQELEKLNKGQERWLKIRSLMERNS